MNVQESLLENKALNIEQDFKLEIIEDKYSDSFIDDNLLVSVIIPVFNEETTIKEVISKIPNHHKKEIIVVDDGSSDNSVERINEIEDRNIKLIKHFKNRGYGAALLTGIKQAKGDIIITLDSDGQHNPEEIPKLIKPIIKNKADIVVGSRYLGKSQYRVPLHTRVGEFVVRNCLWLVFNQKVGNNQSGYRAFTRDCQLIFEDMIHTGFGFCTEILFKASYKNFRITEVPITIYKRQHGTSYVQILRIIKAIASCIVFYTMKKLKINRIFPKKITLRLYPIILDYLKKIF